MITIESYIFRRIIVGLPSNTLNKVFATLNKDITKHQTNNEDYAEICKFILLNKEQGARFPQDDEFIDILMTRNIYDLSSAYKKYLFSRLENGDSKEQSYVIEKLRRKEYTIEHVLPQTLNNTWKENLGENYKEIHDKWLNTLPNLTITGYNSQYSNRPFNDKLTIKNGLKESNLRLNKYIGECTKWTEDELKTRKELLSEIARELWPYPQSNYTPPKQSKKRYTLGDDINFTGLCLYSYELFGEEKRASSWKDMMENVISLLLSLYPEQMQQLTLEDNIYFSRTKSSSYYSALGNYFIYTNCDTQNKITGLRKAFTQCKIDLDELIFNILPKTNSSNDTNNDN